MPPPRSLFPTFVERGALPSPSRSRLPRLALASRAHARAHFALGSHHAPSPRACLASRSPRALALHSPRLALASPCALLALASHCAHLCSPRTCLASRLASLLLRIVLTSPARLALASHRSHITLASPRVRLASCSHRIALAFITLGSPRAHRTLALHRARILLASHCARIASRSHERIAPTWSAVASFKSSCWLVRPWQYVQIIMLIMCRGQSQTAAKCSLQNVWERANVWVQLAHLLSASAVRARHGCSMCLG